MAVRVEPEINFEMLEAILACIEEHYGARIAADRRAQLAIAAYRFFAASPESPDRTKIYAVLVRWPAKRIFRHCDAISL
jgi:hypothetical protein